jgi:hypothetical protein
VGDDISVRAPISGRVLPKVHESEGVPGPSKPLGLFGRRSTPDPCDSPGIGRNGHRRRGYTAALVLYGAPNYLASLFQGTANLGRNILHDQGVTDRIGTVPGVSRADPSKRVMASPFVSRAPAPAFHRTASG